MLQTDRRRCASCSNISTRRWRWCAKARIPVRCHPDRPSKCLESPDLQLFARGRCDRTVGREVLGDFFGGGGRFTATRDVNKSWIRRASFARNDGSPGSTAKVVDFEFTVRHETNNRLNSRTKHLKCPRSVNVLGLLELINLNLYIQLTDIAWTPQATTATSHSPTGSEPDNSGTQPTRISRSRALAAQLSSTDTTPGTTGTSRKRTKVMQPVNSSSTSVIHDTLNVSKGSTSTQPIQIEGESSSSEEQPATKTRTQITRCSSTRTTRGKRAKRAKASQDSGNSNCLYQSPSIKMVGGIPQLYNTPNTGRVAKLRDHATSLLPVRKFSFV